MWIAACLSLSLLSCGGAVSTLNTQPDLSPPTSPPPTVSSVSPDSGSTAGGTGVAITGSGFQGGASVRFGDVNATDVNVVSASQIEAITPAHPSGVIVVQVDNPDGQRGTLTNGFTFQDAPEPTVTAVSPNSGPVSGGTAVIITGTSFQSGAGVLFGTVPATDVTVSSSEQIQAVTPAHAEGVVDITVRNADGLLGTLPAGFTFGSNTGSEIIFLDEDFEDGTFGALAASSGCALSSEQAHSGIKSAKCTADVNGTTMGALSYSYTEPNNPPAQTSGGLYQRWWFRVDQPSLTNIQSGQLALHLSRYEGISAEPHSGWLLFGIGNEFSLENNRIVFLKDNGMVDICNGDEPNPPEGCPGYTEIFVQSDTWYEVQTWYQWDTQAGLGRAKTWIDGGLVFDHTSSVFGSGEADKSLDFKLGIAFTELTKGPVTVYVDDVKTGNIDLREFQSAYNYATECSDNHPDFIFCDDFESGNLSKWDEVDFRYNTTSVATNVKFGNHALEAPMPGTGELLKWWMLNGQGEVYLRFYIKFESGFQNRRGDGDGMHLLILCGNRMDDQWSCYGNAGIRPDGTDNFRTSIDPDVTPGDGTLKPFLFYTYWPDMVCSGNPEGDCFGNHIRQDPPAIPLNDDTWYSVQMRLKLNTPGQSDGLQELWIDGVKKISHTSIRWRDSTILKINNLRMVFFMPAGQAPAKKIWVDNLVISTSFVRP